MLNPGDPQRYVIETYDGAENFIQSLLDALPSQVAILDERGEIIGVNAAWRVFAQQNDYNDAQGGIGTNYLEVCEGGDSPNIANGIRNVMLGQLSEFQMEYTCHSPFQRRWYMVCVSRFEWFNRRCVMVAHTNISDLRLAQIELAQSKRQIETILNNASTEQKRMSNELNRERETRVLESRFLSIMSHELRTPLTSIGLSYDMLKKYAAVSTPEERTQALDNIRLQVDYLTDMVSDVMTLSRFEAADFHINTEDSDLITYCRDVVEEFQFNYAKTHQVEFECEERVLRAPIDRKLLRGALTNLLSNAIKYSPQGGLVLFRLSRQEDWAEIHVSDQGIGIPQDDQERLFEPFHRATNVNDVPGTGLGLLVARQMIALHKGSISFESKVGAGTTFKVRLLL